MTIRSCDQMPKLLLRPFPYDLSAFRGRLLTWYRKQNRALPWRRLWALEGNPYHIWVSEIMLQQTLIKAVLPVYERFLSRYPGVAELAQAREEDVKKAVQGLGYYRRFRMLHQACQQLKANTPTLGAVPWPTTFAGWKELPGVGDYTAAAIASIAFGVPTAVVDGNVERVLCRLFDIRLAPNLPALKKHFKELAQLLLAHEAAGDFNQAMMELGQTVCSVQSPSCHLCPIASYCQSRENDSTAIAPGAKIKRRSEPLQLRLTIVKRGCRYGLFARPLSAKFLKETPGFLTELGSSPSKTSQDAYTFDGYKVAGRRKLKVVGAIKHSITHHRISAEVTLATLPTKATSLPSLPVLWYRQDEVDAHLIANLDRKAWRLYLASL